jgi:hypothetical protein
LQQDAERQGAAAKEGGGFYDTPPDAAESSGGFSGAGGMPMSDRNADTAAAGEIDTASGSSDAEEVAKRGASKECQEAAERVKEAENEK